jgi:hypothetical protein
MDVDWLARRRRQKIARSANFVGEAQLERRSAFEIIVGDQAFIDRSLEDVA